jgi:hypothetical protein
MICPRVCNTQQPFYNRNFMSDTAGYAAVRTEAILCTCVLLGATGGLALSALLSSPERASAAVLYEWQLPESSWRYAFEPELMPTLTATANDLLREPAGVRTAAEADNQLAVTPTLENASDTPPEPSVTSEPPVTISAPRSPTLAGPASRTPAPLATRPPPAPQAEVIQQFSTGFREAGGTEEQLAHALRIVACESSWNVYAQNPAGPFYGLGQFLISTWQRVGGGDIYSAWQQGFNFALLYERSGPGQWPACRLR